MIANAHKKEPSICRIDIWIVIFLGGHWDKAI
jgi:hypothetical protein